MHPAAADGRERYFTVVGKPRHRRVVYPGLDDAYPGSDSPAEITSIIFAVI